MEQVLEDLFEEEEDVVPFTDTKGIRLRTSRALEKGLLKRESVRTSWL